jgi:hypothetical protein
MQRPETTWLDPNRVELSGNLLPRLRGCGEQRNIATSHSSVSTLYRSFWLVHTQERRQTIPVGKRSALRTTASRARQRSTGGDAAASLGRVPAVDSQHLAGNVRRLIRGQEERCLSRLDRLRGPRQRDDIGRQILD